MSLHDVARSGPTKASAPPLTVTLGLPTATEPCEPGKGRGGMSSLAQVIHWVYVAKLALQV